MIIRKQFKFEASHMVRECFTKRCSENIHGHSFILEVLIEGKNNNGGQMVLDFGQLKESVNWFIDLFDHTHLLGPYDSDETIEFIKKNNKRWIILPFNPSAESLCLIFFKYIDNLLSLHKNNYPDEANDFNLYSIIVHETQTGYAQCFKEDLIDVKVDMNLILSSELSNK